MRNFEGFTSNNEYSVGCTGQTVYLYDKDGYQLAKFKDLKYAYSPLISPNGKIFVVKSTEGRLAVYSLESISLIKKFRFSKVDGAQDDNFCFSNDSKELYNIERHNDSCTSALSVYDTSDFSLKKRILCDDCNVVLTAVEYSDGDRVFLLGFEREMESGSADKFFVGELINDSLQNVAYISLQEHDFYLECKNLETHTFTCTGYITPAEYERIKSKKHTLARLWQYYHK